jgi:hypothetical protein
VTLSGAVKSEGNEWKGDLLDFGDGKTVRVQYHS